MVESNTRKQRTKFTSHRVMARALNSITAFIVLGLLGEGSGVAAVVLNRLGVQTKEAKNSSRHSA
jgi:hypothetical protein